MNRHHDGIQRDAVAKEVDRKLVLAFMEKSDDAAGTGRKFNAGEATSKAESGGKKISGGADSGSTSGKTAENADNAPTGILIGKLEDLTSVEKKFVDDLIAQGKKVEIVPTAAGRTPDFVIDGVRYELKTLSGVIDETADGISGAIANRVMNGRGQATDIIVDARNQAGITEEIARRGVRRAFGADNKTGGKITSIIIHGPGWTIVVPRI